MKKLLLANDLSPRSELALGRALHLAREHGAALEVVHVVDEDLPLALAEVTKTTAEQLIGAQLDASPISGQIEISIKIPIGEPASDVLAEATDGKAELILLGMHGQGSLKDLLRGTTAERIIRNSSVPVLVVRNAAEEAYRRVLVATDFSVHARRAMRVALRLAPEAELNLVHGFLVPFQAFMHGPDTRSQVEAEHRQAMTAMIEEEMNAFVSGLEGTPPRVRPVMREGPARDVILKEIVTSKADLVVLGTHGRTGVAHAFLGSVAEDLLTEAPCDVLVVRAW